MSDLLNDRTPPQNIEAEQAVLGAVLLDSDALIPTSERLLPDDFYRAAHQKLFEAMLSVSSRNEPLDVITLT
ncbi:replicative DNA helicase, partial [Pseudomonas sp. GP01-A3]